MADQSKSNQELLEETARLKERIRELEETEKELNLARETVLEGKAQYRFLADNMADILWIQDLNLRTVYISPSIEKMLGFTPEERVLQDVSEQMTPASLSYVHDVLARELALEQQGDADPDRTIAVEVEYYHKDGSTRWGETIISGIRSDRGVLTGIFGVTRDITKRKRVEEESRKKDRTINAFFDAVQESMVMISPEGIVLLSNTLAAQRLERTLQEFEGTCLYDHFPPEVASLRKSKYEKVIATGEPVTFKDARAGRMFEQRCYPVFNDEKQVTGVTIFARDVTELHQAYESLRTTKEKYRALFNESHDAILSTVPDGSILDANPAACEMFGRSADEIRAVGRNGLMDLSDPRLAARLEERARTGRMVNVELTMVRATGERFPAEVTSKIFTDKHGRQRTCMIVRDISERKQLEEVLGERNTRFEKLTANAPGMIYQFMRKPDRTFCLPFTTQAIRDIFGCSPDEVREEFTPITSVVVPEDLEKLISSIESSAREMTVWECEFRVHVPGKPVTWVLGKSTPEKLPDGSILWHGFATDITENKKSQEDLRIAGRRLEALWNITLLSADDIKGVAEQALSSILDLTESSLGFFGHMNTDESVMTIHTWSGEAVEGCHMTDKPEDFPIAEAGLWAEAIRNREPLVFNDFSTPHPARKGLPEGHVDLKNLMVVPLFSGGKITAVAAVANKPFDYDDQDLNVVTSLLRSIESIIENKEAQEALRRSEYNFRRSLEDSPFGIRIVSETGETLFVNLAFLDMFEYDSISEWETSPSRRYTTRSRKEHQLRREKRRSGEAGLEEYEIEIVGNKGDIRHIHAWRRPVVWNGENHHQVLYIDVTQRKCLEDERAAHIEELREYRGRLQGILDNSPLLISEFTMEGRYTLVNRAISDFLGMEASDLIGRSFQELLPPETAKNFMERISRLCELRSCLTVEDTMKIKGKERVLSTVLFPLLDEEGNINAIASIAQDITDRKRIELEREAAISELQRSQATLSGIIEFLPDATLVIDREGRVVAWNKAIEKMTGV
ncbi:MAG: PAS domain S-box protein, partial [Syntrophales bacterium]|nr:PAS domain S-box protein [Syntrophales bacterium]